MKKILSFLAAIIILASCKSSKDYLLRSDEDKTFFDIIKKLNKRSDDEDATKALAHVYRDVAQRHLKKINTYNSYDDIGKWDKLNNEYTILENMYMPLRTPMQPAAW